MQPPVTRPSTAPAAASPRLTRDAEFEASLSVIDEGPAADAAAPADANSTIVAQSMPLEEPQPRWVGKVLGHFKLQRLLGEGAMGRVIQAQDVNLKRIVALKVMNKRPSSQSETQRIESFLREARAAAKIEHPHIIQIFEINHVDGWWYIAMELLEGGSLGDVVRAGGPVSPSRACSLIADAATGLAAAHESGLVHRDIKPANLMITRAGRCKIADFGLVHSVDPNDPTDNGNDPVGTPLYAPPEIIQRKGAVPASDIYALGCTLFFALTGRTPFLGRTVKEVLKAHCNDVPPELRMLLPTVSPSLSTLVTRMLTKQPTQRPTAAQVATLLRAEAIQVSDSNGVAFAPGPSGSGWRMTNASSGSNVLPGLTPAQMASVMAGTQAPSQPGMQPGMHGLPQTGWSQPPSGAYPHPGHMSGNMPGHMGMNAPSQPGSMVPPMPNMAHSGQQLAMSAPGMSLPPGMSMPGGMSVPGMSLPPGMVPSGLSGTGMAMPGYVEPQPVVFPWGLMVAVLGATLAVAVGAYSVYTTFMAPPDNPLQRTGMVVGPDGNAQAMESLPPRPTDVPQVALVLITPTPVRLPPTVAPVAPAVSPTRTDAPRSPARSTDRRLPANVLVPDPAVFTETLAVQIAGAMVNAPGTDEVGREFVVLENVTDSAIDLAGWTITDRAGRTERISGMLQAGERRNIYLGQEVDRSRRDFVQLSNNSGDIILKRPDGKLEFMVSYNINGGEGEILPLQK